MMFWSGINWKSAVCLVMACSLNTYVFCQENTLRGTVKIRKNKSKTIDRVNYKKVFGNRENPLKGNWELVDYKIDGKKVSLEKNTHILEFYDSSYHFRRVYSKPKSRIFEGTFPVDVFRDKLNRVEDTLIKFSALQINNYHLAYVEDSLVFTDLVNIKFIKFTYSPSSITFMVKEFDEYMKVVRTLSFRYRLIKD